jgi:hypothetical protein
MLCPGMGSITLPGRECKGIFSAPTLHNGMRLSSGPWTETSATGTQSNQTNFREDAEWHNQDESSSPCFSYSGYANEDSAPGQTEFDRASRDYHVGLFSGL